MNPLKQFHSRFSLLLLTGFLLPVGGFVSAQSSEWGGTCKVAFAGKSTLHDFDGTVSAEPFTVTITNFENPASADASAEVLVKASKMDTGNKKRDVEMRKSLDLDTYPEISVSVKNLTAEKTNPRTSGAAPEPTVIPFTLKLKGKTHQLTGKVSDWSYADDRITCTVSFPISLSEAGIKPPSVLGLVKVKDGIAVTARLSLARK